MAEDKIKFGNNNEIAYSQLSSNIKKDDIGTEKQRLLFDFFDSDNNGVLDSSEINEIWKTVKSEAGKNGNSIFETEEAEQFLQNNNDKNSVKLFSKNINAADLFSFLKALAPQKQISELSATSSKRKTGVTTELRQNACKETVIGIIDDNISEAEEIFRSQNLGAISGAYDNSKNDNDKLKTSNVQKVLDYQKAGEIQLIQAKEGTLTKRAYYEENKQRIKDMILTRLTVLESSTGVSFLDQYKGKYTKEQLAKIISDYVETICNNAEMDKLKEIQKHFVSYSMAEEPKALNNFVNNAIDYKENRNKIKIDISGGEGKTQTTKSSKGIIPSYWDSAEPISFEEVYKIERGTEYSQHKVEQYVLAKKEMETVANAYNRKQQFVDTAKNIADNKSLTVDAKIQKIMELYSEFYALAGDEGLGELKKIVDSSNSLIKLGENGLDLSAYKSNGSMKQSALNKLLSTAVAEKEKDFETFLGGKTIEEYQEALEQAANNVLGDDNAKMLADAMKNDNMTAIQRYTGNTSMTGMGITVVGGILCFTPLAPLGAAMVTGGNVLAIGGMVAKTGLNVADYATKDVQTSEELTDLAKDFIVDAGGFIIGMKAGKAGLKAFNKLIDKKLTAVFSKEITAGNRMQALKTVLTTPEYLKNFMTAAGAKISTDFMISYIGDLAMMGLLDTKDDWRSLLQANLTGILVGMSGDIKDAAGVGKSAARARKTSGTTGEKPLTQQEYGMIGLGKEVTVKEPVSGAEVNGTVTKINTTDGKTNIEVNGKEYSTDDIVSINNTKQNNSEGVNEGVNEGVISGGKTVLQNSTNPEIHNTNVETKVLDFGTTRNDLTACLKDIGVDENTIKTIQNLSDRDLQTLRKAFNEVKQSGYDNNTNIDRLNNFVQILKDRCAQKHISLSEELQILDTILKMPSDKDNIIDCVVTYRIPDTARELEIIERLLDLQKNCDNPLINIDNIVYLANMCEKISDIELLVKRLEAKNDDGTYKYGANDYNSPYDIDPEGTIKDIKQQYVNRYKDNPEVLKELNLFLQGAKDEEILKLNYEFGAKSPKEALVYLREKNPDVIKSDIEEALSLIKDNKFNTMLKKSIEKIENSSLSRIEKAEHLKEIRQLADIHNNLNQNYVNTASQYWKEYLKFLKKHDPELAKTINGEEFEIDTKEINDRLAISVNRLAEIKANKPSLWKRFLSFIGLSDAEFQYLYEKDMTERDYKYTKEIHDTFSTERKEYLDRMLQEFKESQRIEGLIDYCKNNTTEAGNYLYQEVYLNSRDFAPEVKQKLSDIATRYNVKIFLDANIDKDINLTLMKIEDELSRWKKCSKGTAKMPPTLDFTHSKRDFIDNNSAYGQGAAAGFSENDDSGAISINSSKYNSNFISTLRHEMTHTNDTKRLYKLEDHFVVKEGNKIIANKCKYYDEFVKIGISKEHIAYAYNNPQEFIAVASEGDLSKCSPEFKQQLIDFGMPEWRFNF